MEFAEFKRILTSFADEPSDIDVHMGKVVAQIRDDLVDVEIRYSSGPDRLLQVVDGGVAHSARSWLISRVARLPQLADRIIATTAVPAAVSAKSPFVTPAGRLTSDLSAMEGQGEVLVEDVVVALVNRADNPSAGASSVLYLTSDAGEGKTTVINRAARRQAERFKARETSALIVPIPLSGKAFLTFDDAVIAALVNKLRFSYLYFDAFIELVKLGAIVPAFDGYEEMLVEGSKGEAVSALGNLVQRLDSTGSLVIAARKAFFEYVSFKTQARLLDAIGDKSAVFSKLSLQRWSKERFCEYGRLRKVAEPLAIYDAVSARLGEDHPLLTRAVLVRRLFDVAEQTSDKEQLAALLGQNPNDYFFTFVDAIVKREASEKWLSLASGDLLQPLLTVEEHHQILSMIAQEMWQTSTSSLRYDVLDTIVELFGESSKKGSAVTRQVKERLRQHSLLAIDSARGQALAFDHEDFQNFYLGEGVGNQLVRGTISELQAVLAVGILPVTTTEQSVQYLLRNFGDVNAAIGKLIALNSQEIGFSFSKENYAALLMRLAECKGRSGELLFEKLYLPAGSLSGRNLVGIEFVNCHFQPTKLGPVTGTALKFSACEFERLELDNGQRLDGYGFSDCRVDALLLEPEEEQIFDPAVIAEVLTSLGAGTDAPVQSDLISGIESDYRLKLLERFLRVFLRSTHIDEDFIRVRMGKVSTPQFLDEVFPTLLGSGVLEEVPWRGRGIGRRYKLAVPMAEIDRAIGSSRGDYDKVIAQLQRFR